MSSEWGAAACGFAKVGGSEAGNTGKVTNMSNEHSFHGRLPSSDSHAQPSGTHGVRISRRDALRCGILGAAGVALGDRLGIAGLPTPSTTPPSVALPSAALPAKAKAVIQLWMWGGPCHLDTFDPKPEAGSDYCGSLRSPIATNVNGTKICELLPELAKQADKYSIIRSMTHGQNGHETAAYLTQTGRMPGDRFVYPCAGAVVSLFKGVGAGYDGLLPPYIVLTQPQGRFSEAGFLGVRYKPFATGGDPGQSRFAVEGIVAAGITDQQQRDRRDLLHKLNTLGRAAQGDPQLTVSTQAEKEAYDLMLGDAGRVFDLSQEKDDLRARYGRSTFGQSCLVARRLIERGVRFVTINYNGWDTHKEHFQTMRRKLPELDKGMATLLQDLADHDLLESTIVWWSGEFGRTPKVQWEPPWNGGRSHWGKVFSAVVAGGGFKGGHVIGASDAKGEEVKERPVYPCDLIGSMYQLLGIDPDGTLPHPLGLPVRVTPSAADGAAMGGRLKEIM
jgi:hypothetical protein